MNSGPGPIKAVKRYEAVRLISKLFLELGFIFINVLGSYIQIVWIGSGLSGLLKSLARSLLLEKLNVFSH
jgi:hypothetical protein